MHIFTNTKEGAYDSLKSMVSTIENGSDKKIYDEILEASDGVFVRHSYAEDRFVFNVRLPSVQTNILTLYRVEHQSGSELAHLIYAINGELSRAFLDEDDPLTLNAVLNVESLRIAPMQDLHRLNTALKKAVDIVQKTGGQHD